MQFDDQNHGIYKVLWSWLDDYIKKDGALFKPDPFWYTYAIFYVLTYKNGLPTVIYIRLVNELCHKSNHIIQRLIYEAVILPTF